MRARKFVLLCLIFVITVFGCQFLLVSFEAKAQLSSSAKAAVVMETSSKRLIFSKNENQKLPMASTTKIMIAITVIEHCKDLDEKFEVSKKSIGVSGTSLYLKEGDCYSARDLLYALMLISGNDASVALAERVAGSTSEFVTLMNSLAQKIGATNTHFANPHGLDADGHYTTAYDLALITSYALENDIFCDIVSTKNHKITNGDGQNRYLKNKNKLLFSLDGCIGVKTGYTDDAGRCLVSAIEKDGMRLVCVVLNCRDMFPESSQMLSECASEYQLCQLCDLYEMDSQIKVFDGRTTDVSIGTKGEFCYPLTKTEKENLRFVYNYPKSVTAPLDKGAEIGNVEIFLGNDLLFSEKIYTIEIVRIQQTLSIYR